MIGQAMKEIIGKNEEIINPYYVENTAEVVLCSLLLCTTN
jgi:hypothetical protein